MRPSQGHGLALIMEPIAREAVGVESMHALLLDYTDEDGFEVSVPDDMHALPVQIHRRGRL